MTSAVPRLRPPPCRWQYIGYLAPGRAAPCVTHVYCMSLPYPQHKQRTKFLTLTTQAGEHACCPGHHSDPLHGSHAEDAVGIPCLPEPPLGIMQQHMLSAANRWAGPTGMWLEGYMPLAHTAVACLG